MPYRLYAPYTRDHASARARGRTRDLTVHFFPRF